MYNEERLKEKNKYCIYKIMHNYNNIIIKIFILVIIVYFVLILYN